MKKLNQFLTYFRENLFCERQKNDTEICENETKYATISRQILKMLAFFNQQNAKNAKFLRKDFPISSETPY